MKIFFKIILFIAGIGIIIQIQESCNSKAQIEALRLKAEEREKLADTVAPEITTERKQTEIKNNVIQAVSDLNYSISNYMPDIYRGAANANIRGAEQLNDWRIALIDHKANGTWSDSILMILKEAKSKLIKLKVSELPKLRVDYVKNTGESLWDRDIYIKVIGKNKDIIEFTGGIYAANRSKKQTQESLYDDFMILGFKKVIYKWYKGQTDYSYYTMNSNPDNYFE